MSFFSELKRRNVIRVGLAYILIAWVILQVIDFLLELTDAPSWVLQVFFITALVALPIVLLLSWVYEMTPEGIKLEKEVARDSSITPSTGRKLDRTIIAFLAVTVVFLVGGRYFESPVSSQAESTPSTTNSENAATKTVAAEEKIPSIAVLPFVNMSSDPEQDYFADGISEEILNSLARVNGLKVAGRTSSFAFKGENEDLRIIAEALGVENILEGSVRKQGDQVRITAQLVQASDGFHLWSDTFDRKLTDIFAIQDEIANAILQQTQIQLLDDVVIVSDRVDPIAYQNYVAAKQRIHERTKGGLKVARNLLSDAVQLDPDFAAAWAEMAIATMLLSDGFGSYGDIPEEEAQAEGKRLLEKALLLDPEQPEALAGMGLYWQNQPPSSRENINKAIGYLQRSLKIDPHLIDTNHWTQRAYQFIGRFKEAEAILEKMVERDPLYWPAVSNLVLLYARQNRFELAHELNDRTMRYRPELPFRQKALLLSMEGKPGEAAPLSLEVWSERSDPLTYISVGLSHSGIAEYASLADLENAPDSYFKATALALLDRREESLLTANSHLSQSGRPFPMIHTLALLGDYQELEAFINERWPDLDELEREYGDDGGLGNRIMLDVALAFERTGSREKFNQAMEHVRISHEKQRQTGFDTIYLNIAEAQYWALVGNEEQALKYLQRSIERGYSAAPRLARVHPQLTVLEGVPRYEELQAKSLAHMNEQRALLDLPPLNPAY